MPLKTHTYRNNAIKGKCNKKEWTYLNAFESRSIDVLHYSAGRLHLPVGRFLYVW